MEGTMEDGSEAHRICAGGTTVKSGVKASDYISFSWHCQYLFDFPTRSEWGECFLVLSISDTPVIDIYE